MSREAFEARYAADWRRFEDLLGRLERFRRGAAARGPAGAGEFPALYRRVCHQLALARERSYGADLEQRLNHLALRGHQQLYRTEGPSWRGIGEFLAAGFPAKVRAEARLVLAAAALLVLPGLATGTAVGLRPELVYSVMEGDAVRELEQMYQPDGEIERTSDSDLMMFGFYVYNNVGIAFRTFAAGVLLGLGSVFFLVHNGLYLGAVTGFLHQADLGGTFYPFVIGHAAFELPAIVLAGAAGLRLGLAVLAPGRRSRTAALFATARGSLPLIYGTAFLLLVAAFVEAFWSSTTSVPAGVRYAVGAGAWVAFFAYVLLGGRRAA
jgi:uncharacterized membrane protein SpoIIM required for sporulation